MISVVIGGALEDATFETWLLGLPATKLLLGAKRGVLSEFCRRARESSRMLQLRPAFDSPRRRANDPIVVYFPTKASKFRTPAERQELGALFPRIATFIEVAQDYRLDVQVFADSRATAYMEEGWPKHWPPLLICPPEKNLEKSPDAEAKND